MSDHPPIIECDKMFKRIVDGVIIWRLGRTDLFEHCNEDRALIAAYWFTRWTEEVHRIAATVAHHGDLIAELSKRDFKRYDQAGKNAAAWLAWRDAK